MNIIFKIKTLSKKKIYFSRNHNIYKILTLVTLFPLLFITGFISILNGGLSLSGHKLDLYKPYEDLLLLNSGTVMKKLELNDFFNSDGIYIHPNGYIVGKANQTSTDYEFQELKSLCSYIQEQNCRMLYVNAPTKLLLDDEELSKNIGVKSYGNQNADKLFRRLNSNKIPYLDLRENVINENKDIFSMFYKTDHHWTAESGLWCARHIAEKLNSDYGYNFDLSRIDDSNLDIQHISSCWIGEQGQKISEQLSGRDDFWAIKPKYETHFTVNKTEKGGYDLFLSDNVYQHYAYCPFKLSSSSIVNKDVSEGKILLLCDSFSYVVVPFLAQGIHQTDTKVLRETTCDLKKEIKNNKYDTVIILYAQFMIGAHDDPNSANYNMFSFGF